MAKAVGEEFGMIAKVFVYFFHDVGCFCTWFTGMHCVVLCCKDFIVGLSFFFRGRSKEDGSRGVCAVVFVFDAEIDDTESFEEALVDGEMVDFGCAFT